MHTHWAGQMFSVLEDTTSPGPSQPQVQSQKVVGTNHVCECSEEVGQFNTHDLGQRPYSGFLGKNGHTVKSNFRQNTAGLCREGSSRPGGGGGRSQSCGVT